jgi:hypothetical protein
MRGEGVKAITKVRERIAGLLFRIEDGRDMEIRSIEAEATDLLELFDDFLQGEIVTLNDAGAPDEEHCSCVPTLRARIRFLEEKLS